MVKLYLHLLLETKIVLTGRTSSVSVDEMSNFVIFIESLLWPMEWEHTLITVVPASIVQNIICIPTPTLMGILEPPDGCQNWKELDEVRLYY